MATVTDLAAWRARKHNERMAAVDLSSTILEALADEGEGSARGMTGCQHERATALAGQLYWRAGDCPHC